MVLLLYRTLADFTLNLAVVFQHSCLMALDMQSFKHSLNQLSHFVPSLLCLMGAQIYICIKAYVFTFLKVFKPQMKYLWDIFAILKFLCPTKVPFKLFKYDMYFYMHMPCRVIYKWHQRFTLAHSPFLLSFLFLLSFVLSCFGYHF